MAPALVQVVVSNPLLAFLVAIIAFPTVKSVASFLWLELRSSSLPRYKHGRGPTWALVTGASDGIGFGFVSELATQGFNVILHGRNQSKVDGLIKELKTKHPGQSFRAFIVDSSDRSKWDKVDEFARILNEEQIRLTVLVNNVGGGSIKDGSTFVSTDAAESEPTSRFIDTNAIFPVQVTRALLPILKVNQPSLVITMGSAAGILGLPYLAIYSGSKAFNFIWSRSLRRELMMEKHDIEVFSVHCGKVSSPGTKMIPTSLFVPDSARFAKSTLQRVGSGHDMVTGYWGHAVQFGLLSLLPSFLLDQFAMMVSKEEIALQKKAT